MNAKKRWRRMKNLPKLRLCRTLLINSSLAFHSWSLTSGRTRISAVAHSFYSLILTFKIFWLILLVVFWGDKNNSKKTPHFYLHYFSLSHYFSSVISRLTSPKLLARIKIKNVLRVLKNDLIFLYLKGKTIEYGCLLYTSDAADE